MVEVTQKTPTLGSLGIKIRISQLKMDQSCKVTKIPLVAEKAKHFSCNKTNLEGKREMMSRFPARRVKTMTMREDSK
jgi:hypothetical protein